MLFRRKIKVFNPLHGVCGDKLVVVLSCCDQQSDWMLDLAFKSIKNYVLKVYPFKNVVTVVKQHPDELPWRSRQIKRMAERLGLGFVSVVQNEEVGKLVHACDLVIAIPTTCIIDCILLNKPVVVIDKMYFNNNYSWQENDFVPHLRDENKINKAVLEALL